jgi:uncharacterized delta-60 repeat protein
MLSSTFPPQHGRSVLLQPDGKIIAAGDCSVAFCIARYLANGSPDASFGNGGRVINYFGYGTYRTSAVALQADGKIVQAGSCLLRSNFVVFCVGRYNADGSLDTSFGSGGMTTTTLRGNGFDRVVGIGLRIDGKIVVAGSCGDQNAKSYICFARYREDGSMDADLMGSGIVITSLGAVPEGVALQADGGILVTGSCLQGGYVFCTSRFGSDGRIDTNFGVNGTANTGFEAPPGFSSRNDGFATAIVLQRDGKIIVSGGCYVIEDGVPNSDLYRLCAVRYLANGQLDLSFAVLGRLSGPGSHNVPSFGNSSALQSDGKLLIGGNCGLPSAVCVTRFLRNGAIDVAFGSAGVASKLIPGGGGNDAASIAVQSDGRIVTVGKCDNLFCITRFEGGPPAAKSCGLNIDDDLTLSAVTDATLVIRYLFGARGDALTTGALGQNPTRTGQALEAYLASLNLDADGDGQALAMTDGLLLLRAMLGLTGTALTQGATNAAHPNVRNAQQILTWMETTHGVACLP